MKKHLLAFSLMLTSFGLFSQSTVWDPRDINVDTLWGVRYMSVVDTNSMWATAFNGSHTTAVSNRFTRTEDGNTFTAGTFMADSDTNYYSPSSIVAVNDSTAYVTCYFIPGTGRSGIVKKTVDRGQTWTYATDTTTMYLGASNFPNWTYFWNENDGITMGDPNGNYFEIWKTSNGGTSWTRVPQANIAPQTSGAYGVTDVYTTYGANHIWFGTIHASNANNHVYRSNDRGLTWQSSQIPGLQGGVNGLSFRDSLNGMAFGYTATTNGKFLVKKTNDGGITWTTVPQYNMIGQSDICAVPGRGAYMSVGIDSISIAMGGIVGNGIITSVTYDDGKTWQILEGAPGGPGANVYRMLKVSMIDSAHGWAGTFSDNQPTLGKNGANKWMGPVIAQACPINVAGANNVCSGTAVTLTANGTAGASYTWTPSGATTNTVSVSPASTSTYVVNSAMGSCTNTATYVLTIKPTPTVTASAANDTICNLNSASLSATGATTYNWIGSGLVSTEGANVSTTTYTAAGTYTYAVTGATNGCNGVSSVTVTVLGCIGVNEHANEIAAVYPNPSHGTITVDFGKASGNSKVVVTDMIGKVVFQSPVAAGTSKMSIDLSTLPKGIYLVSVSNNTASSVKKMIIE